MEIVCLERCLTTHVALLPYSQHHNFIRTLSCRYLGCGGQNTALQSTSIHGLHCSVCIQLLTLKWKHWPDHTKTHSEASLKWHLTDVLALDVLTSSRTNNKFINRDPAWIPSMDKTFSYSYSEIRFLIIQRHCSYPFLNVSQSIWESKCIK